MFIEKSGEAEQGLEQDPKQPEFPTRRSAALIELNGRESADATGLSGRPNADAKPPRILAGAAAALALFGAGSALANPHSVDPMDWLIQHICVGSTDRPIAADPYYGCPAGSRERRLGLRDPMPYLRHDQPGRNGDHPDGYQRHDAYPIIDVHTRTVVSANDFDFDYVEPYAAMHPGDGDGFDLYRVANGYASGGGTRDDSGYSQTFFGPDCKPYGGWIFFPVSFLDTLRPGVAGRGIFPIRGVYWEQNGEPWPGRCTPDRGFSRDALTTWEFVPAYPFGGQNGATTKRIDAIVSTHGFEARHRAQPHFHLERFYFTDLYGVTRWEAWEPSSDRVKATENCAGDTEMSYEGVAFTLADCRDWSAVQLINPPRPRLPWPYPEANLLQNWHFDHEGMAPWQRTGATSERDNVIKWGQFTSRAPADLRHSQTQIGVRYVQVSCGGGECDPDQAIYQDLPIAGLPPSSAYDYGFSGVIDGVENGAMRVTLSERDRDGKELWSTSFDAKVRTDYHGKRPVDSAYNASSVFLETSPPVTLRPGAATLRFSLSPRTPGLYDVLDTWLMPR
jgi:hypothetical protein